MSLYPVAGCKFYIGGQLDDKATDFVASDFTSQSWTEVDGWSQMGDLGDTTQTISTDLINRGRTIKQKGTSNAGSMQNVFAKIDTDPGQIKLLAAVTSKKNYAFKVQLNDVAAAASATVTVSVASPGVITDTAHGLSVNDPVVFSTTGALPTGLTAGTTYYVKTVVDANSYTVSATAGGTVIATTGTQSGVHTRTTAPTASQRLFVGLVMSAQETGGEANAIRNLNATVEINSNIVTVAATL